MPPTTPSEPSARKASAVAELELTIRHKGTEYIVLLDVTWEKVDDSFDHAFGTEHRSHWEAEDYDVQSVIDEEGDELDADDVPGLHRSIREKLNDYDYQP